MNLINSIKVFKAVILTKQTVREEERMTTITTEQGQKLQEEIKEAYKWKDMFPTTNQEFMTLMSQLFIKCQEHTTALSSLSTQEAQEEADAIVDELIAVRNHWGPNLFPPRINALARESMTLSLGGKDYRIDSAQYFEPVPYYEGGGNAPGELMKLFRFSVYDLSTNEIILRYFLERSNIMKLYHVLCFALPDCRGQIQPYGEVCPSYWQMRRDVIENMNRRFGEKQN